MAVQFAKQWLIDGTEAPRDTRDFLILLANRQIGTDKSVGELLGEVGRLANRLDKQAAEVRDIEHSRPDIAGVETVIDARELKELRGRVKFWRNVTGAVIGIVVAAGVCATVGKLLWLSFGH